MILSSCVRHLHIPRDCNHRPSGPPAVANSRGERDGVDVDFGGSPYGDVPAGLEQLRGGVDYRDFHLVIRRLFRDVVG